MAFQKIYINRNPRLQADIDAYQGMVSGIGQGLDSFAKTLGEHEDRKRQAKMDALAEEDRRRQLAQAKANAILKLQEIADPEARAKAAPAVFAAYGIPFTAEDARADADAPQFAPGLEKYTTEGVNNLEALSNMGPMVGGPLAFLPKGPMPQGGSPMPDGMEFGGNYGAQNKENEAGLGMAQFEQPQQPQSPALGYFDNLRNTMRAEVDQQRALDAQRAEAAKGQGALLGQKITAQMDGRDVVVADPRRDLELRQEQERRAIANLEAAGFVEEDMPLVRAIAMSRDPKEKEMLANALKARQETRTKADATAEERKYKEGEFDRQLGKRAAAGEFSRNLPPPPEKMQSMVVPDLNGGFVTVRTPEGAEKLREAQAAAVGVSGALDRLSKDVLATGREALVPGSTAEANRAAYVNDVISYLTTLYNTGVLNGGEYDRYQKALNTTLLRGGEATASGLKIMADGLHARFNAKLQAHRRVDEAPPPAGGSAVRPAGRSRPVTPQERASAKSAVRKVQGGGG